MPFDEYDMFLPNVNVPDAMADPVLFIDVVMFDVLNALTLMFRPEMDAARVKSTVIQK